MNAQNNKTMPIATIGMDKQTRRILEMVFSGPGRGEYILVEKLETAEGTIFDLDHLNASKSWANYRTQYPHLPTIVLSLSQKEIVGTVLVKKPFEINHLLSALHKLKTLRDEKIKTEAQSITVNSKASQLTSSQTTRSVKLATILEVENEEETLHQFCGYAPDIHPERMSEIEKVYYDPDKYLQGFFEKAFFISQQLEQGGILIEGLYTPMILSPDKNQLLYYCGATEGQWRTMALLPLSKSHLRMVTLNEIEIEARQAVENLIAQPLDKFLWKIALWTARGRLPKGSDLHKDIILLQWPNFTRLVLTPHALEISALWTTQSYSLLETAKVLEIPQRYVFSFFSAVYATKLGYIDKSEKRAAEKRALSSSLSTGKRNLFQRLLARLRGHESL